MKLAQPYRCDYCLNMKGEANHWLLRDKFSNGVFRLLKWEAEKADTYIDPGHTQHAYEHICGQECALKALTKWLEYQKWLESKESMSNRDRPGKLAQQ